MLKTVLTAVLDIAYLPRRHGSRPVEKTRTADAAQTARANAQEYSRNNAANNFLPAVSLPRSKDHGPLPECWIWAAGLKTYTAAPINNGIAAAMNRGA